MLFFSKAVTLSTDLNEDLKTENFLQNKQVKLDQLLRQTKRLGVSALILGRLARLSTRFSGDDIGLFRKQETWVQADLEIKVFHGQSGHELGSWVHSGEAKTPGLIAFDSRSLVDPAYQEELIQKAIKNALLSLVSPLIRSIQKLSWEGRILQIKGHQIYVNAGRASGLQEKALLKVLLPGDELYDPVSGAFLGMTLGQSKGTIQIVDFIGEDGAVGILHTGGNFHEADLVQLY